MHTNGRHRLAIKANWQGTCTVQPPSRFHCRNQTTPKATEHTQKQPNKPKTHTKKAKWKVIGDPVQWLSMRVRWQHCINSSIGGVAKNKKRENTETQTSHCHTVEWVKQHSTMRKPGIPPARIPRSHRASHQGITTHTKHFDASNDNAV